jgi:hypothetical protein
VRGVGAEGFVKSGSVMLKVNERNVFLFGHEADGVGVAAEGVGDFAAGVERAAAYRGAKDGEGAWLFMSLWPNWTKR